MKQPLITKTETESEIRYRIKLHKNQTKLWNDPTRFKILCAGRRFGKTFYAVNELIRNGFANPELPNWYIAPTYSEARDIVWDIMKKIIPESSLLQKPNETRLEFVLTNKAKIALKGADNEQNLRGRGLSMAILDEYSKMKSNVWGEIVRPMLIDTQGKAIFISTPKGKDHFYKMFQRGVKDGTKYKSWKFTTYDNPHLTKEEIQELIEEVGEHLYKQEILASFEDYEGLIWPEFDEKYHVIPEIRLPKEWEKQYVIDMATSGVVVCLEYVTDFSGNIIFTNEYYGEHRLIQDHCKDILAMAGAIELSAWACKYAFYETQINQSFEKFGTLTRLADLYRDFSINLLETADTSDGGRQRVANLLHINMEKTHPFRTNLKGAPQVFFFERCKKTREQVSEYRQTVIESKVGIKSVPIRKNDHCCECVTRAIMALPAPAKEKEVVTYDRFGRPNIGWYMKRMIEEAKREKAEQEYAENRMGW